MLRPGDIVTQKNTKINKINFKDNKPNRLSVVLFHYIDEEGKLYYCTAPVTNATKGIYNKINSSNHYYMNHPILSNTKFCCVKLDSAYLYNADSVHHTSLNVGETMLYGIYKKMLLIEPNEDEIEFYNFVKIMINDTIDRNRKALKKEYKEKQKEKKLRRKELKNNYKK